jgi:hypothetical protein
MPSLARIGALLLAVLVLAAGCAANAGASFDPTGACSTDGKVAGAYPDIEALVPKTYRGAPPETLDSGRNCTPSGLGPLASLGIDEVRFAGGTWTFGADRAVVLAVFRTSRLDANDLATFFTPTAQTAARTKINGESNPTVAGRPGHRIDTTTSEIDQSVIIWPATAPDVVNVVISSDLPEARIQDAIDAYGGR